MTAIGWTDPAHAIVPNDAIIARVQRAVDATVSELGTYPHEYVDVVATAVQTTRLLKVVCTGPTTGPIGAHDPYILRMSASQYDRGAPFCGIDGCAMPMRLS